MGAGFAFALLIPAFVTQNFLLHIAILVLFSAYLGQAWNIAGGYAGQRSFGHAVFVGTGAYVTAILQTRFGWNPWLTLPPAIIGGAAVGWLIGFLSFRAGLRGSYFALITLAFSEVARILANSLEITRGGLGILVPLSPGFANFQFANKGNFFIVVLAMFAVAFGIAWWLEKSRFGARLVAVRENEDAAAALGVDTFKAKLHALMLSGGMAALGGSFYVQYYLYVEPPIAYGVERSVEMLLVSMIGGSGTVLGPLVGSIALHLISDTTRHFLEAPGVALILYGIVLILIVGFLPDGLISLFRRRPTVVPDTDSGAPARRGAHA
ncbi:MAG: branched-chain amino acid ABC transporter permease [Alphaproteobacteria bacterium]|nr:branched-chain amino acid ABC transporter permease [Alphaproteobacteria bacterium]